MLILQYRFVQILIGFLDNEYQLEVCLFYFRLEFGLFVVFFLFISCFEFMQKDCFFFHFGIEPAVSSSNATISIMWTCYSSLFIILYYRMLFWPFQNDALLIFLVEVRTAILETNCVTLTYYIFGMSYYYYYIFYLLLLML